ncbi:MAG TPA: hypothetical protein VK966_00885, partial [Longimicrobiales bacterium]|nr:hypothetical protein [Longimicrobiales bacterium]
MLSIAVVMIVNVLFPPAAPPDGPQADSVAVEVTDTGLAGEPVDTGGVTADTGSTDDEPVAQVATPAAADTVWVETDVVRYGIST